MLSQDERVLLLRGLLSLSAAAVAIPVLVMLLLRLLGT